MGGEIKSSLWIVFSLRYPGDRNGGAEETCKDTHMEFSGETGPGDISAKVISI